jgi:putative tricarboxylic transport membrane protein
VRPRRRGPLALAAGIAGLGLFFFAGAFAIPGEAAYAGVGPRAFPLVVGGALIALGILFAGALGRGLETRAEAGEDADASLPADWAASCWVLAGLVLAVLLVERAGFPLTAALVFILTARGFGSRRLLRDAVAGLLLGLVAFLVFARGLGVSLPGGPFG